MSNSRAVCDQDHLLDDLHVRCIRWITAEMRHDPDRVEAYLSLFSSTRHLERVGDMAMNIAEDIIYMLEAQIIRHGGLGKEENPPESTIPV